MFLGIYRLLITGTLLTSPVLEPQLRHPKTLNLAIVFHCECCPLLRKHTLREIFKGSQADVSDFYELLPVSKISSLFSPSFPYQSSYERSFKILRCFPILPIHILLFQFHVINCLWNEINQFSYEGGQNYTKFLTRNKDIR